MLTRDKITTGSRAGLPVIRMPSRLAILLLGSRMDHRVVILTLKCQ